MTGFLEKYFPNSKAKLALAKFIRCCANTHKVATSRIMLDKSDPLRSALGMHYEVNTLIAYFLLNFFKITLDIGL